MFDGLLGASAAALALGVALMAPAAGVVRAAPAPTGPGCAGHTVVAHHAGGALVQPPPPGAPAACGVSTGFPGAESHIVATGGAVAFTPAVQPSGLLGTGTAPVPIDSDTQSNADPAALAVTADHGATWSFVKPSGLTWNPTDHGDFADPATNRVFFEDYGPIPLAPELGPQQEGPAYIMWTDRPTDSAGWHRTVIPELTLPENPRFAAAHPPTGQAAPAGYPNVVYFCANTNVGFVSPVITGRLCFKSLDGGSSFTETGILFTGAAPQHPECGGNGEIYSAIDGYYPQPAPDGSLYVMVACGGTTYLARSVDEAATFPILHTAGGQPVTLPVPPVSPGDIGSPDLRIGPTGTMYLMWTTLLGDATKLVLSVSGDAGRTWTRPVDVTAPGVRVGQWAMAERDDDVAVAYLGRRPGQTTQDAYITETRDAGALLRGGAPLFWSAVVNSKPILYGDLVKGSGYITLPAGAQVPFPPPFGNQMFGNDFIGATIAPDGSPWGAFDQDCGPSPDDPTCQAQHDQTRGFAGRLVFASAPTPAPAPAAGATRTTPATGGSATRTALGLAACAAGLALATMRRRRARV